MEAKFHMKIKGTHSKIVSKSFDIDFKPEEGMDTVIPIFEYTKIKKVTFCLDATKAYFSIILKTCQLNPEDNIESITNQYKKYGWIIEKAL